MRAPRSHGQLSCQSGALGHGMGDEALAETQHVLRNVCHGRELPVLEADVSWPPRLGRSLKWMAMVTTNTRALGCTCRRSPPLVLMREWLKTLLQMHEAARGCCEPNELNNDLNNDLTENNSMLVKPMFFHRSSMTSTCGSAESIRECPS